MGVEELRGLIKFLDRRAEEIFIVITMAIMVVLIFYQVVSRYIFNNSLSWTEEFARYVHIWQIWIAASFAVRQKRHIKVEVVKDMLPKFYRRIVEFLALILWFFLAAVLAVVGTEVVSMLFDRGQTSPAMRIPIWIAYAAVPVGGALMSIRLIQQMVLHFKGNKEEEATKEG